MRTVTIAALLGLLLIATASAQTPTAQTSTAPSPDRKVSAGELAPEPGTPLNPQSAGGLGKEAADGSTLMVPAVPCSTAARETDGTTTCVGIAGPVYRTRRPGSDTTVGRAR